MLDQDKQTLKAIEDAILTATSNKPRDRSENDRYYAIVITELEKVYSLFKVMVVEPQEDQ